MSICPVKKMVVCTSSVICGGAGVCVLGSGGRVSVSGMSIDLFGVILAQVGNKL